MDKLVLENLSRMAKKAERLIICMPDDALEAQEERNYLFVCFARAIPDMIAEIENQQLEIQYLKDWAQIDIDAAKTAQDFEDKLAAILDFDPDMPQKARRQEILEKVSGLDREIFRLNNEADWLAATLARWDERFHLTGKPPKNAAYWREAYRTLVRGNND